MLLQHAWLAPLAKPATITEEDEDEAEAMAAAGPDPDAISKGSPQPIDNVADKEVADWVKEVIEKKRSGRLGKAARKPALHAAPLDAVSSPSPNGTNALDEAAPVRPTEAA
jgi:mitogen-activated protein kinase kinase